jgi:hypothetical protein
MRHRVILLVILLHIMLGLLLFNNYVQHTLPGMLPMADEPEFDTILAQGSKDNNAQVIFQDIPPVSPQHVAQQHIPEQPKPNEAAPTEPDTTVKQEYVPQQIVVPELAPVLPQQTAQQQEKQPDTQRPTQDNKKTGLPPSLTFASIAKGFLESTRQEAGMVDVAQQDALAIARSRYSTRVLSDIKQAVNCNKNQFFSVKTIDKTTKISLTISEQGQLLAFNLISSEKTKPLVELEHILSQAAYSVGLFPAIPKILNKKTITISFPLTISLEQGMNNCRITTVMKR